MTLRAGVRAIASSILGAAVLSVMGSAAAHAQVAPPSVEVPTDAAVPLDLDAVPSDVDAPIFSDDVAEPPGLPTPPSAVAQIVEKAVPVLRPASTTAPEASVEEPSPPRPPTSGPHVRAAPSPTREIRERKKGDGPDRSADLEAVARGGDAVEATLVLGRELTRERGSPLAFTGYDLRVWVLAALLLVGGGCVLVARARSAVRLGAAA